MRDPLRPTVLETLREQGKVFQYELFFAPFLLAIYLGALVLVGWGYFLLFQYLRDKAPDLAKVAYLVLGAFLAVWAAWILLVMFGEAVASLLAHCVARYRHTIRSLDPDPTHVRFLRRVREEEDRVREMRERADAGLDGEETLEE